MDTESNCTECDWFEFTRVIQVRCPKCGKPVHHSDDEGNNLITGKDMDEI